MARGWESKSVEDQQTEAAADKAQLKPQLSAEQIQWHRHRQGLELSRHRVQQQLLSVQNLRHREMLQRALADLEKQLGQFTKD
jgi:hypothetical protein